MKEKLVGVGAVVSAGLTSVCCIGPVVLAGLGLGGIGLVAGFAKYRLLFLVLTLIFLGAGFYLAYRKREVRCNDGSCQKLSAGKGSKIFLWVVATAVVALLSKPYWSALVTPKTCCAIPSGSQGQGSTR